jgi:hypothetical protein
MADHIDRGTQLRHQPSFMPVVWVVGVLVLATVIFAVVKAIPSKSSAPAPLVSTSAITSTLAAVPAAAFATVGSGTAKSLPQAITAPASAKDGKPWILYAGAEFCPYCAAERWPMVVALSRFGTFTNLGLTHSSTSDVYPDTQTLSFHGASYTSQYITFTGVETMSNVPQGDSYAPLDVLTSDEQKLVTIYDAAPYVPATAAGSIPFVDFGGKFLISGATYDPGVLQGKTAAQIAAALATPSDTISQAVLGTANTITAAVCELTTDQPTAVCSTPAIQQLESSFKANPASNG